MIRLTAPPVDGAANEACRVFLAELLAVRRADVALVAGERAREKRFRIEGVDAATLRERLTLAGVPPDE